MKVKVKKAVIYVESLQNVVEVKVLPFNIVEHYKESPEKLFILGVNDSLNVMFRVSQKICLDKLTESEIKPFVYKVSSEIINSIIKISKQFNELGEDAPEGCMDDPNFDASFLSKLRLKLDSLIGGDQHVDNG